MEQTIENVLSGMGDIKGTPSQVTFYMVIKLLIEMNNGCADITINQISDLTGFHKRTIRRAINFFNKNQMFNIEHENNSSLYSFSNTDEVQTPIVSSTL